MIAINQYPRLSDEEYMREAIKDGEIDTRDLESAITGLATLAETNRDSIRLQLPDLKVAAANLAELIDTLEK